MALQRFRELTALRRRLGPLSAGVVDAGMASIGTFIVSAYAARYLDPSDLGAFALFRSVVFLAGVVPIQGVFVPIQVHALTKEPVERLRMIRRSVGSGLPLTLASCALVMVAIPMIGSAVDSGSLVALTVTAVSLALFSPIQTHVRRMAHVAESSRSAAYVSSVYAVSSALAVLLMHNSPIDQAWLPLGAMAAGNAISLAFSLFLFERGQGGPVPGLPSFRDLWRSGRWLVVVGSVSPATTFLSVFLVTAIAGAEVMGTAEAVRVVCQPVFVVGMGLGWVLMPHSVKAAQERDRTAARRWSIRWYLLIGLISIPFLMIAGWPTAFNPFVGLFPTAYAVTGLVALQIMANTAALLGGPLRAELIGGGREKRLAGAELIGNIPQPAVSTFSFALGATAKPLADLVSGLTILASYTVARRGMYSATSVASESG